jgi:probable O-glycosylation ligase (exosortase A-associated)
MRDAALFLFVIGLLPFVFKRPYIGVLLWAWLGYMNPHRLSYGFAYSFPFVLMAAAVTLLAIFLSSEKKSFPVSTLATVWLLFVAWVTLKTPFALNPEGAYIELDRFIKIQLMIFATLLVINTRERLNWMLGVIALSIGFYGIKGGAFVLATGGKYMVWGPENSFIEGNNEIAFALVTIVPLLWYMQLQVTNKWIKWGLLGSIALCCFSIIGSYSRGAFLAICAMLFVLWLKSRKKAVVAIIGVIAAVAMFSFMPTEWLDRMNTIQTYEEDNSALGRINSWWAAFNVAVDKPIMAGGFDFFVDEWLAVYAPDPEDINDAHSIYFEVLGEQGFIGLFLFLLMGFLSLRTGSWIIRYTKQREDLRWAGDMAAMLQVSFVGYAVGGAFLGLAYFDLPYHLMAMLVLLRQLVTGQVEEEHKQLDKNLKKGMVRRAAGTGALANTVGIQKRVPKMNMRRRST